MNIQKEEITFTIFTPTYNRAHTLKRVYHSLLRQTCKDFIWLIIDDGSTDKTPYLVEEWRSKNQITIDYRFKSNEGKHTAMALAFKTARTKYLIGIDSDDELEPDAIDTFKKTWEGIAKEGLEEQFAEVSGLTYDSTGKLVGDFYFHDGVDFIDSNWHEMVLKRHNNNEHIVCWDLKKLQECVDIPENFWLSNKVNMLGEGIFWARLGRRYKTRYINKGLRIYHYDAGESLLRISDKTKGHYNNLASNRFFLDENLDHFLSNPKYFINLILKYAISGIELDFSPLYVLRKINTNRFKIFYVLLLPPGILAWFYFKKIKKNFWF